MMILITYIDKKNKIKKDIIVDKNKAVDIEDAESKNILDEFGIKEQIKFVKSANYNEKNKNLKPGENVNLDEEINNDVHGLNDVYPVEGFIEFYSAQNNRKIKLHTYKYPSKTNIKGIVYYVHGLNEHSNYFANFAKILANNGYEVLSFDLRGHGKSNGKKAFFENEQTLLEDVNNFINMTYGKYFEKTMNKFLIGYSLGSVLAYNTAVNKEAFFDGLVMIGPPILLDEQVKPDSFKFKFLSFLNKILPGLPLLPLKSDFTKNALVIEKYKQDNLVYKGKMKLSTVFTILKLSKMTWDRANHISKTPLLLIHGKDDIVCSPENAVKFFERVESKDKEMILLDDVCHDVIKDKKYRDIANDVVKFFDKNLL